MEPTPHVTSQIGHESSVLVLSLEDALKIMALIGSVWL